MTRCILACAAPFLALAVALSGCGSGDSAGEHPSLIVSAASSLRNAFSDYGAEFDMARVRLSFGGSDELAAQIRLGGGVDVFAAANAKLPEQLYAEGKVEAPVTFTANRLVLAVPAGSTTVNSVDDLTEPGVKIAIGSPAVPIGSYTRQVLDAFAEIKRDRILTNVASQEPDVAGIVGKLTQGAVDAGFVYATDVRAAHEQLRGIELPGSISPAVAYKAAVVKGSAHPAQARAFLRGLLTGKGREALAAAGFLEPVR